jgi:hypothetical protein
MLKKFILSIILFFSLISIYSGDKTKTKIEKKLVELNIKNFTVKDSNSKLIKKLYIFNDNKNTGGIAVTEIDEYKLDIIIVILKLKESFIIKSVEVIDENALKNKDQMNELIEILAKLNETKINDISDSITGATKYSKKMYTKIKVVASLVIKELEK